MESKRKQLHIISPQSSESILVEKNITENGDFNAADDNADGYSAVHVAVPTPVPTLITKQITQNGTYAASGDNADGYSEVTVNVPAPENKFKSLVDGSITSVTFGDLAGVTSIRANTFNGCRTLRSIDIPSTITSIGTSAFNGCEALTDIKFPSTITVINNNMFYNCTSLRNVIILGNITAIGSYSFTACRSLQKVVIESNTVPTLNDSYTFPNAGFIYVQYSIISSYASATNWSALHAVGRVLPLVATVDDLTNIDTTTYTKACVIGADESYKEYTYDGSQWNEVV